MPAEETLAFNACGTSIERLHRGRDDISMTSPRLLVGPNGGSVGLGNAAVEDGKGAICLAIFGRWPLLIRAEEPKIRFMPFSRQCTGCFGM